MNNAIIVLNYNDYKNTIELVNIIKNYEQINYIIIVDNCSTNNSFEKLKELQSNKTKIIKTERNGGYAYGNNYGIKYAIRNYDIDYVIIANPDIRFEENTIELINDTINSQERCAIVAPILDENEENYWKIPKYHNILACPFLILGKKIGNSKYKKNTYEIKKVDVVSGAFFAITKKAYLDINGFDEDTFLYFEENIIACRLKQIDYNSYIISKARFKHKASTSIDMSYKSKIGPYKIYIKSVNIYANKYLKINTLQYVILYIFICLGYLERYVYDFFIRMKTLIKFWWDKK